MVLIPTVTQRADDRRQTDGSVVALTFLLAARRAATRVFRARPNVSSLRCH